MPNPRDANLVCPKDNCGHQLTKNQLLDEESDSFQSFVEGMSCPECGQDFHPEDGVLEYFNSIPLDEAAHHSLSIGGFCSQGTLSIEPGQTEENSLITSFSISVSVEGQEAFSGSDETELELGLPRIWDPDGRDFDDVVGDSVNPNFGPILLSDDQVVADITEVSEPDGPLELAFTTSIREGSDLGEVSVGYHYDTYLANVQEPSWIELLREGIKVIYDGTGRAPYPLFISAFDNLVLRQLYRTAQAQGWSTERIDSYFEGMRWKDWVKEGLEEFTGERLPSRDITLYQEFDSVRSFRNTEIVHLTHSDELPQVDPSETLEDFRTVLDTMLEVYTMCVNARQDLNDSQ